MKKKIIITGGQGFIGSKLKAELIKRFGDSIELDTFDLKGGNDILFQSVDKCDFLFHLAAQTSVQESVISPAQDCATNILGTIRVLQENPEARIILTGSCASLDPKSPYGISKLAQELYTLNIHKNSVVCRLTNVFSSDDHGVVNAFLNSDILKVNGDGLQTRDFVHVEDVIDGLIKAMEWQPGAYELGSGKSTTILDLAKATGKPIEHMPELPGEIKESKCFNTTPNWYPKIDVLDFIKSFTEEHQ
jgi:UDP-glucose 4-epimerase